jgi:hypothetical protein
VVVVMMVMMTMMMMMMMMMMVINIDDDDAENMVIKKRCAPDSNLTLSWRDCVPTAGSQGPCHARGSAGRLACCGASLAALPVFRLPRLATGMMVEGGFVFH